MYSRSRINKDLKSLIKRLEDKQRGNERGNETHPADDASYIAEPSYMQKESHVAHVPALQLKMINRDGIIRPWAFDYRDLSPKHFYIAKFSANVKDCLADCYLLTSENISKANKIKLYVYDFHKTNAGYKVNIYLPIPYEDIVDNEHARGIPDGFLARILVCLLLSLDDYYNSGDIHTKHGKDICVGIIGCIAGICQYIDEYRRGQPKYSHVNLRKEIRSLRF